MPPRTQQSVPPKPRRRSGAAPKRGSTAGARTGTPVVSRERAKTAEDGTVPADVASMASRKRPRHTPSAPPVLPPPSRVRDGGFGLLLATGLVVGAAGLLAASALQLASEERRKGFREKLAHAILPRTGETLISATLGRGADNRAFWDLTLEDGYRRLRTVRVYPTEIDVYSDRTCIDAAAAVADTRAQLA